MGKGDTSETQYRSGIIASVKTPLSFFVLTVLVGEAGLLAFTAKTEGIDRTVGIVGMIVLLLASCAAVYFLAFRGDTENASFCRQIEGVWWEKINHPEGSVLSFFSITAEPLTHNVVLEGISFGNDGEACATWRSEMIRLYPADRKIVYLWRGKHPLPGSAHHDFHGYGTFEFHAAEDVSAELNQGRGDFWDVDQTHPRNTVLKPCELRRITDEKYMKIMTSGSSAEKRHLVRRLMNAW